MNPWTVCFGVILPTPNDERLKEVRKSIGESLKINLSPSSVKALTQPGDRVGFFEQQTLAIMHGYTAKKTAFDVVEKSVAMAVQRAQSKSPEALVVFGVWDGVRPARVFIHRGGQLESMEMENEAWKAPRLGPWSIQLLRHVFSTHGLEWANDHFPQQKASRFKSAWKAEDDAQPLSVSRPRPRL